MAPLTVDPTALDSAGNQVVTAGEGLGSVISTLSAALAGCAGMAGDDPAGASLGHSYDSSAAKLVEAMVATRNGLCGLGIGVRMSARNYSVAELQSNVGAGGGALPAPALPGPISAGRPPSAVGSSDSAPPGWGWVAPYLGMIWPTGDSAKLRVAATAWSAAGTQFGIGEIVGTGTPMGAIRAQQIPEGPAIDRAFADAYRSTTGVVQQCQQIAAQLTSYAAKIEKVHAAILDLLSRICDPLTGFKEVWDILTDQDEDEIKKIADDIRTVVDNFKSEVDALEAEIASTLAEATTIVTPMAGYAAKQWDQFLHTTPVGHCVDRVGHGTKEFFSEAGGFAKGLYDISQVRLLLDPAGYFHDINGMARGAMPLVGLGPDGGPGVLESWKTLGKDVSHWDQWTTDPAGALGRTAFDGLTLALPGGPLSKLGTKSRAALDALKDLKAPPLPKLPDPPAVKPPEVPKPPAVPGVKPPEPGSPAPPPKPGPAPTTHGPTEPKPTAVPHGSGGKPPLSTPADVPHPHERVPTVPAGRSPGEPVGSATAPAVAPAASVPSTQHLPSAPHLPSPPIGSAPGEVPLAHGATPHGSEPSAHGLHEPHDRTPYPPDDGQLPHGPRGGNGHPSADGPPHEPGDGTPGGGDGPAKDQSHDRGGEGEPPKAREVFPDASEYGDLTEDQYRHRFVDEKGNLTYPDAHDPAKPYAIPGTVHDLTDAEIKAMDGKKLDRIGHPGGEWLAPEGAPYGGRSLPHTSLDKPYYVYTVHADVPLPPGWKIELSRAAPWFGHRGGEPQYLLIPPKDAEASVQELLDIGFLTEG
ncbi:TNT domain-containing protein [Mycobacterium sherrisii]|uniref:TNT domain-containing protein n=1 Tax=Mycobacterium sherrisii TaxID=243061 RepID=UPI000A1596B1|nr:TNT domain-containing protein [Mycobacterium sherrisii]MCV7029364.1 glycohydrolase toxin TNT-related protein [Mycobacterium sherrisii]ORW75591.1 NAD(+)--arginine ADP-ribosyltransferase [Mycobacterium sherrisii]